MRSPLDGPLSGFRSPVSSPGVSLSYDLTEYEWAEAWFTYINPGAAGTAVGQIRDVGVLADGTIVATGGQTAYAGSPTPTRYVNTGGTSGSGTPLTAHLAWFDRDDGSILRIVEIGSTTGYERAYALDVATLPGYGEVVVIAGRASDAFYTTTGAYQETFQGDSNPNTNPYGPQDGFVSIFDASDGTLLASSYVGAGDGDLVRDVRVLGSSILLAKSRYGGGTPTTGNDLVSYTYDLSDRNWVWSPGNSPNSEGGTPSVTLGDGYIFVQMSTDAEPTTGTTTGALEETWNGGQSNQYIAKLTTADPPVLAAATYLIDGGGVVNTTAETHTASYSPLTKHLATATVVGFGFDAPITLDAAVSTQHGGTIGTSGLVTVLDADLTTVVYCSFIDGTTNDVLTSPDGCVYHTDGRFAVGIEKTTSPTLPVTDGSTYPGYQTGAVFVFAPDGAGSYVLEFGSYVPEAEIRCVGWTPEGDLLIGGRAHDGGSGRPASFVQLYDRLATVAHFNKAAGDNVYLETPAALTTTLPAFAGSVGTFAASLRKPNDGLNGATFFMSGDMDLSLRDTLTNQVRANFKGVGNQFSSSGAYPNDRWFTFIATFDFDAGAAAVYIDYDGTLTKVITYTSLTGSQVIGTNVLSMLKGSAFGMECAWLRCWNVYTSDGSIPSETPLIDEGPDAADVNAGPYKVTTDGSSYT